MTQQNFHIDRLKVCFKAPAQLFRRLYPLRNYEASYGAKNGQNRNIVFQMVRGSKDLAKVNFDKNSFGDFSPTSYVAGEAHPRQHWFLMVPSNDFNSVRLPVGELTLDENIDPYDKDEVYAFITIENEFLYHGRQGREVGDYVYDVGKFIKYVTQIFNLKVHGVTYCEIAADISIDPVPRLLALLRDPEVTVIMKNRAIKDREEQIDNMWFECFTSLNRFTKAHLRICNKGKNEFYCYNKAEEIDHSNKTYIYDEYGMQRTAFWRMEVRIDNEYAKLACKKHRIQMDTFLYNYLLNPARLPELWRFYAAKFIRFKINRRHVYDALEAVKKAAEVAIEEVLPTIEVDGIFERVTIKPSQTSQEEFKSDEITLAIPPHNAANENKRIQLEGIQTIQCHAPQSLLLGDPAGTQGIMRYPIEVKTINLNR